MNIKCTRYRVKQGKTEKVNEWLAFLNENMEEVLVTLEGEKMYVETIFREVLNGEEYLYWYVVQGTGGIDVDDSEHWIDKKHIEYWDECIDKTFKPVDLQTEVVMIPEKVRNSMN
ncbi:hypothetical protein ABE61_03940 [Lysinibacillus sphaericus]|uniref:DUF6176 family protein n=1 Tax=Lysinibacillus sphaericus TaxID=1421 RepID=UPI0018CF12F3|nr:DUF6176 family protein [Lysinibacillus sphaericus]MBG9453247.1 hypothetical protein [Lysinibacillus sphaericus]MBG9476101.1 hypothetical protein [Lysinibacillus sphaericus]MBG9591950.1 hypothetical protein [Lysinibacillus sphaericus]